MSVLNIEDTLLVIIDIQDKLVNAVFNDINLRKNVEILAKAANILNIPSLITEQYPKGLGNTINSIKDNLPSAEYFEKNDFNALCNKDFFNKLKSIARKQIILCGIETHICVRQTVYALLNKGYDVSVVKDICGSRNETEHIAGLNIMSKEGCFIKTTEMILFELLKSSKHPAFKEIQALIK